MSNSCAVLGVVKLKTEQIPNFKASYLNTGQESSGGLMSHLFGVNVSHYIQTHFDDKAASGSFNSADFANGILIFVSGFSSYDLHKFINLVVNISESHFLYAIYENSSHIHNEIASVKDKEKIRNHMSCFDKYFIDSEITFDDFTEDGTYHKVERFSYDGFDAQADLIWELSKF